MPTDTNLALTPRQQRFVEEYLRDPNATQAARAAGFSARWAKQQGARLLRTGAVATALAEAQTAREARTTITADAAIQRIVHILDVELWQVKNPARRLELKLRALELLGRHTGAFKDRPLCPPVAGTLRVVFGGRYRPSDDEAQVYKGLHSAGAEAVADGA
jgi:hypothetical protein